MGGVCDLNLISDSSTGFCVCYLRAGGIVRHYERTAEPFRIARSELSGRGSRKMGVRGSTGKRGYMGVISGATGGEGTWRNQK